MRKKKVEEDALSSQCMQRGAQHLDTTMRQDSGPGEGQKERHQVEVSSGLDPMKPSKPKAQRQQTVGEA